MILRVVVGHGAGTTHRAPRLVRAVCDSLGLSHPALVATRPRRLIHQLSDSSGNKVLHLRVTIGALVRRDCLCPSRRRTVLRGTGAVLRCVRARSGAFSLRHIGVLSRLRQHVLWSAVGRLASVSEVFAVFIPWGWATVTGGRATRRLVLRVLGAQVAFHRAVREMLEAGGISVAFRVLRIVRHL